MDRTPDRADDGASNVRETAPSVTRRTALSTIAGASTILGMTGVVGGRPGSGNGGFPPNGITEWGRTVNLGDGTAQTFTTVTPSDQPKYHGVLFDRTAFEGLPSPTTLEESGEEEFTDKYGPDGEALEIHHRWSLEFFIPFPETDATPFTFLGLNWNPDGHGGGGGAWVNQHFDIHFHMDSMAFIDAIEGPRAPDYDLPSKYIPEGFARSPPAEINERVITDMGEHMVAPADAPEVPANPDAFSNTLIWGVNDEEPEDVAEGTATLSFVEPMITREYFRNHQGTDTRSVAQPEVYADAGNYPTAYSVRDVPSDDAIAVTIEDFQFAEGEE